MDLNDVFNEEQQRELRMLLAKYEANEAEAVVAVKALDTAVKLVDTCRGIRETIAKEITMIAGQNRKLRHGDSIYTTFGSTLGHVKADVSL